MTSPALSLLGAAEPTNLWQWLGDSSQRNVSGDIPGQLWTTLSHALAAGLIAALVAIPLAAVLAHYRKAEVLATAVVNLGRVIPTITLLGFAVLISLRNGFGFAPWPIIFALAAVALPPLFVNTYTAVREASPDAVDAARATGLTELQILTQVELPLGLPLILATARVTLTQVVATEALGALFGSEGLGIYVRFGFAVDDLYQIQAGALLVAGTAVGVDLLFWLATRFLMPSSLRRPGTRSTRRPTPIQPTTPIQPIPLPTSLGGTP